MTVVVGTAAETTKHDYCSACWPAAEADHQSTYNPQPSSPPPVDIEHITAAEYLLASSKASCNGIDKPAFTHINERLKDFPLTRQRLAFEMLPMAWQSLEAGVEPGWELGFAACCGGVIPPERQSEYVSWLEKIIIRSFELRSRLLPPPGRHGPFALTLSMMLTCLARMNRSRFTAIVEQLKDQGGQASKDARWEVIAEAEKRIMQWSSEGSDDTVGSQ